MPSCLRRQTQVSKLAPLMRRQRAFWSTNVGVGSNPTPDRIFLNYFVRPLNILVQLLILRLVQTSRNVDKKSKCYSELLLFCILLTYLALLRTENKYFIFLRQVTKYIPKIYMSMDCYKCGIFEKIFPANHAQTYACLFSIGRKL